MAFIRMQAGWFMHIAILGINYAPEEIGIGRYTTDLARNLVQRGHTVSVVAGKPYYPKWKIFDGYADSTWQHCVEDGVNITRCPLYVPKQPSGPRRILHLASFALSALLPALRIGLKGSPRRPDVVMCIAPSLLSIPVAWLCARVSRSPLWLHVQDFEVEAAFATGLLNGETAVGRLARGLENMLLRVADYASSISPQMCEKLVDKGFAPNRVYQLRNWADSLVSRQDTADSPYRQAWNVGNRHVCLYSGNIANKQGIEILVAAARLLAARDDILFVICGEGPNRANLVKLAEGLTNIQFHDLQPSAQMGNLLSLASVHLLPQIPGAADLVLPSKLTNMLASGRPVIATTSPGTGLHGEVEGCGINVEPGDAGALAAAVVTLIDDEPRRQALGDAAIERARERWSVGSIIDRLDERLATVASSHRR